MIIHHTFLDIIHTKQITFQDPATPVMEGIINFHNELLFFIILIVIFVMWVLGRCIFLFKDNPIPSTNVHGTFLEIIWTITPAIILLVVAIPSFALLYSMDEIIDPTFTLKVIGHQWYWNYEYSDNILKKKDFNFDSYMLQDDDLEIGNFRLLEVDNRTVLPINTHIRVLITAGDVLHSWAVPSLGVKLDACPGRLNQTSLFIKRAGVYFGQCSEICGINHGFMPIVVEAVSLDNFINWFKIERD